MKMVLLGDVGLFGKFGYPECQAQPSYFDEVAKKLEGCDLIVANLETPFAFGLEEYRYKSAYIRARRESVQLLLKLGVTHVNLANNHIGDYGVAGIESTISVLEEHKIDWFGVKGKYSSVVVDDGSRINFFGFCNYDTNGLLLSQDFVHPSCPTEMEYCIAAEGVNVLSVHSGVENVRVASPEDILLARYLAGNTKSKFIYHGHHPHVIQGTEEINGNQIFYSLGNFIFDDVKFSDSEEVQVEMTSANKIGCIPIISISGNEILDVELNFTEIGEEKLALIEWHSQMHELNAMLQQPFSDIRKLRSDDKLARESLKKKNLVWYWRRLKIKYVFIKLYGIYNRIRYRFLYRSKLLDRDSLG